MEREENKRILQKKRMGSDNPKDSLIVIGANSSEERQKYDFYATHPIAVEKLLQKETFNKDIWECACGLGHISEVLKKHNYNVLSTDIIKRGYEDEIFDFLGVNIRYWHGDIITNPPYIYAKDFVERSLMVTKKDSKIAMLLPTRYLESVSRYELFLRARPYKIYVFVKRIDCAKNGDFEKYNASPISYAWFLWINGYNKETLIDWIL